MDLFLAALLIFSLRVADQTLGSMRIVMLISGRRGLAGFLGFFESMLWLLATALVLDNIDSPLKVIAFAGGFAVGNMMGGTIERWIALGKSLVRVVSPIAAPSVAEALRSAGFGVTVIEGEGLTGTVEIVFTVVPRKKAPEVSDLVHRLSPDAFVTVESTETVELSRFRRRLVRK